MAVPYDFWLFWLPLKCGIWVHLPYFALQNTELVGIIICIIMNYNTICIYILSIVHFLPFMDEFKARAGDSNIVPSVCYVLLCWELYLLSLFVPVALDHYG